MQEPDNRGKGLAEEAPAAGRANAVPRQRENARELAAALSRLGHALDGEADAPADVEADAPADVEETFLRLPAPASLKSSRFRYLAVNPAFEMTFGRSAGLVSGRTDFEIFGQEIGSQLWLQDFDALSGGMIHATEQRLPTSDKQRLFLLLRATIGGEDSRRLLSLAVDLRQANRVDPDRITPESALNALSDAVAVVNSEGVLQFVNEAFSKLTRYPIGEAVGLDARLLDAAPDDVDFEREIRRVRAGRQPWRGSRLCRRRDGGLFWSEVTISPITSEESESMAYVIALRDITAYRNLVDVLQRTSLLKSEFTAAVSHELRTPLTALKESVDVVAQQIAGPLNDCQREFLSIAGRNVDRLQRIITDTLDLSRLESGSVAATPRLTDLNAVVGDVLVRMRPLVERAGFRLEAKLDPSLAPVWVDPRHLDRAMQSILDNVVRHATPGPVSVSTRTVRDRVQAAIADSGPGIDADAHQSIFEPYVQLSVGPGRKVGGAGIGLSISKRLIEANRGRIWVESEPGAGSTFYLEFPPLDEASQGDPE